MTRSLIAASAIVCALLAACSRPARFETEQRGIVACRHHITARVVRFRIEDTNTRVDTWRRQVTARDIATGEMVTLQDTEWACKAEEQGP